MEDGERITEQGLERERERMRALMRPQLITGQTTVGHRFMYAKQAPYKSAAPDRNITFLTPLTGII